MRRASVDYILTDYTKNANTFAKNANEIYLYLFIYFIC